MRKAQQEVGATLEKILVQLELADANEIAGAYAEYLHLPLAKVISSNFGDIAVQRFGDIGVTRYCHCRLPRGAGKEAYSR